MLEFMDIIDFFVLAADNFKKSALNFSSSLDEMVLKSVGDGLAYVDNRRDALKKYDFDFWRVTGSKLGESALGLLLKQHEIDEKLKYSKSEQFPDFVFRVKRVDSRFTCGSLLELKDSEGASIASFNSTLPTKSKNLEEVDVVNGESPSVVSRITSFVDGISPKPDQTRTEYYALERKCFYLVRTHKSNPRGVKVSLVDGAFFETVPKEHLIYQMFLQILHKHIEGKKLKIPDDLLRRIEETLSHVTDQSIIAASQVIEKASVRPRLRIMAEVHSEGNPHSSHYPEVSASSFNLILQSNPQTIGLGSDLLRRIPELRVFPIQHKRNGEYTVFQLRIGSQTTLDDS